MKPIKISKNLEGMDDATFLKNAIKELQSQMKNQGKQFQFDVEAREIAKMTKAK